MYLILSLVIDYVKIISLYISNPQSLYKQVTPTSPILELKTPTPRLQSVHKQVTYKSPILRLKTSTPTKVLKKELILNVCPTTKFQQSLLPSSRFDAKKKIIGK